MYNDYPTIYESTINQNFIYLIILAVVLVILLCVMIVSLAKIFKKANRSFISAFIPFYNIFVLLEIVNLPKWYFLLLLVPGLNLIIYINVMLSLAKFFRKSKLFGLGLSFLPFVFYPLLAFSDSEYIGINIVAMEGKSTVVNIPKIVSDEEKNPVVHEEVDDKSKNINISIGGGVYQKNYTKDLLQVDQKQAIINSKKDNIDNASLVSKQGLSNNIDSSISSLATSVTDNSSTKNYPNDNINDLNKVVSIQPITINEQINSISLKPTLDNSSISNVEKSNDNVVNNNDLVVEPKLSNNLNNSQSSLNTNSNSNTQTLSNNQIKQNDEFTFCPKCGARVKANAKTCFLCGKSLE